MRVNPELLFICLLLDFWVIQPKAKSDVTIAQMFNQDLSSCRIKAFFQKPIQIHISKKGPLEFCLQMVWASAAKYGLAGLSVLANGMAECWGLTGIQGMANVHRQ